MKISILTVTYGDRFQYLKQVLDVCILEKIESIIIIDNASKNKNDIEEYIKKHKDIKFIYHRFEENKGSAGGFKKGVQEFKKTNSDFVIFLDDDNLPGSGFLEKYKNDFQFLSRKYNLKDFVLKGCRDTIIKKDNKVSKKPGNNSFSGIDIFSTDIFKSKNTSIINEKEYIEDFGIFYGGSMISKNIINYVGDIDDSYQMYADDSDYGMRIINKGYKIFLSKNITIKDLQISYNDGFPHIFFAKDVPIFRIFFTVRNSVIVSLKNVVDNKLFFFLNLSIWFCGIITLVIIKRKLLIKLSDIKVFILIFKSIWRGLRKDLSVPNYIKLP